MSSKGKYVYDWPRPMVTVDAVVFAFSTGNSEEKLPDGKTKQGVKLLLVKRGNEPFKGYWALPGGFVGIDEELDRAVARELAEETGLIGVKLEQMHTFGKVGRDPRGRQITVVYMGIVDGGLPKIKGGDDATEAGWFDIEQLPSEMAFDHHKIAEFAIGRLKKKKTYRRILQNKKET